MMKMMTKVVANFKLKFTLKTTASLMWSRVVLQNRPTFLR